MENKLKLWYKEPSTKWVEALPIGNGKLGAMVFGNVFNERIALNEDTLWTGVPKNKNNYEANNHLEDVRKLIFKEKYYEAQELMNSKLLGGYTESYAPMGNLYLDFDNKDNKYEEYRRELDLNNAKVNIEYKIDSIRYKREIFVSAPDNVMIIKITSDTKNSISLKATLDSLLKFTTFTSDKNNIDLKGITPIDTLPSYVDKNFVKYDENNNLGMRFHIKLNAKVKDGFITSECGEIIIKNSSSVILTLSACTSFNGFDKEPGIDGKDEELLCLDTLKKALGYTYEELYNRHIQDYHSIFNKLKFSLGSNEDCNLSTKDRLKRIQNGKEDLSLLALYFQFGRYLLISSSRKGSQPANLQGIWNEELSPPWSSNYTVNINTEMNYWPTEVCNLSECHEPLFEMLKELSITGSETARVEFGCRGWTANHNIDLWRYSSTVGGSSEWGYWPMGGAWLCQHLWEHYKFTMDKEFLKEKAYPIMKESAKFLLDWLVVDKDGTLVTCPSTSPENNFLDSQNRSCCASKATTMDIAIIKDLFSNCVNTIDLLNVDLEFKSEIEFALNRLPKYKINKYGGLQEWFEDFREKEPGHRHISHLFGLYPGKEITEKNQLLFNGCKETLKRRLGEGGGHTGWSCSWIICFYARLKEASLAYKYLKVLLSKLTYSNLFCVHPPFQIDGNFGGIAAIAEMIIQSHDELIDILPAIPLEWNTGEIYGLKARGGFAVDIIWKDNIIKDINILSTVGGVCTIRFNKSLDYKFKQMYNNREIISLNTERGRVYNIEDIFSYSK